MNFIAFIIHSCLAQIVHTPFSPMELPSISVAVMENWHVSYATDVQDVSFDWASNLLVIRSNADGKIYLASPFDCSLIGDIDLPSGADGFGVAVDQGEFYINSSSSGMILHSDGSDSWTGFANPAGTGGAGMDIEEGGYVSSLLCEASASDPYQFYGIETDGTGSESYQLPGVTGEISGYAGHGLTTLGEDPPMALIVTTRYGHELLFYHVSGSGCTLYGQENCPLDVAESLGLAWSPDWFFYWSYKDLNGDYWIAKLAIGIFGSIEEETAAISTAACLAISQNPSRGSATVTVNLPAPGQATLEVYDLSGRLVKELHNGQLASEENSFGFTGSPGIYTAVLGHSGQEERLRFVLTR